MADLLVNGAVLALVVAATWSATRWMADRTEPWQPPAEPPWPDACPDCEGVGALVGPGRLRPCPTCEGTGR